MTTTAPYGSWASPISVEALTTAAVGLAAVRIDRDQLYWLESHADQAGRVGTVAASLGRRCGHRGHARRPPTSATGCTSTAAVSTRSATAWSSTPSDRDGRVYRVADGGRRSRITPPAHSATGTCGCIPIAGWCWPYARTTAAAASLSTPSSSLDLAGPNDDGGTVLCAGADFYATPELSESGRLAWTQWSHPHMPWDCSEVMVGRLSDSAVSRRDGGGRRARGVGDAAALARRAVDPALRPDRLVEPLPLGRRRRSHPLHPDDAEYALPQWTLGQNPVRGSR